MSCTWTAYPPLLSAFGGSLLIQTSRYRTGSPGPGSTVVPDPAVLKGHFWLGRDEEQSAARRRRRKIA